MFDMQPDYLDALRHILNHMSKNPITDCKEIIFKILKSVEENESGKDNNDSLSIKLSSIVILLKLYLKLLGTNVTSIERLNVNVLLDKLSNFALNLHENYIDENVNTKIFEIISLLFKVEFFYTDHIEFIKVYYKIISALIENQTKNTLKLTDKLFKLKFLHTLYTSLLSISESKRKQNIIENFEEHLCQLDPNLNEYEVFLNLLFNSTNNETTQLVLQLIIQYSNFTKRKNIVQMFWDKISTNLNGQPKENIKFDKVLLVLCCLSENTLLDLLSRNQDVYFVINNSNFWKLIQLSLTHENITIRKQGMYLLKKSLVLIERCDINSFEEDKIFRDSYKISLLKFEDYLEIITILEFLDEQQFHIVEPIFEKIKSLVNKFTILGENDKKIFSWIVVIHEKGFMHDSTQVLKLTVNSLVNLPKIYFSDESTVKSILRILIPIMNNLSMYYADGMAVSQQLIYLFKIISVSENAEVFYCSLVNEICNITWSPESLFFVSYALSKTTKHFLWKEKEIFKLNDFVSKAFQTYNKTIKFAIQTQLLHSILNLTNTKCVSLENVVLLLSKFSSSGLFQLNPEKLKEVVKWLLSGYSKDDAEDVLDKFKKNQLSIEFKVETIGFMSFIFYYSFGCGNCDTDISLNECFTSKYLIEIFLSFKDLNKRLYCDESFCHQNLFIIYNIIKESYSYYCVDESKAKLLKFVFPFLKDVALYIYSQIKSCSSLQDFHISHLMIKIYKLILKIENIFTSLSESFNFSENLISDLASILKLDSNVPFMQMYSAIKILEIVVKNFNYDLKLSENKNLIEYLEKHINDPLKREEESLECTKDVQILWGRLNSKFLKAKWILFESFIRSNKIVVESNEETAEKIAGLCVEGVTIGGYGVLCPVMMIMKNVIHYWNNFEKVKEFIDFIWHSINERRKTKKFKVFLNLFVEMVFHVELYLKGTTFQGLLCKYSDLLFEDPSIVVANTLVQHFPHLNLSRDYCTLAVNVISKGIIYGSIMRKDEKLINQIIGIVKSENICRVVDFITSNEVRAKAINKIVGLSDGFIKENLLEVILNIFNGINQNKNRYFGDSYIHKVKLRTMQALLVLQEFETKKVSDCLLNSIKNENSQPSVRYLQEWYFILQSNKKFLNEGYDLEKPKAVCSFVSILYHLCVRRVIEISDAIGFLMPLCMDQHFEVRLYSQVLLDKLLEKCKVDDKSELRKYISDSITRGSKGNALRNVEKLKNNFYFTVFDPKNHYSLETIFMDLPRLTNVGSEEWIPVEVFKNFGFPENSSIFLENPDSLLRNLNCDSWLAEKYPVDASFSQSEETKDNFLNYQKKIIPNCDVTLNNRRNHNINSKGDLIVVASLIDRIPNLGGLARTCEIFGVSEFVVNSLKHLQNKEFTRLSVTAEKWINIKEVKLQNLQTYLNEMKKCGYTIVGAEQAIQSKCLSCVKFPKKSVLLLGNEKEGIPPNLLPFLDVCVEIPQIGIIRSLNVHVSGALFIWEYAKQICFSS